MSLLPALAIGRLLSRLFLKNFIGQQGQQQALQLLDQIPQGLPLGLSYLCLLVFGNIIARCDNRSHLA